VFIWGPYRHFFGIEVVNWLTAARSGAMAMMKQKMRYKMYLGKSGLSEYF